MTTSLPIYRSEVLETDSKLCDGCPSKKNWAAGKFQCRPAPIRRFVRDDVQDDDGHSADLLVVGDVPSHVDNNKKDFFTDPEGQEVLKKIKRFGLRSFILAPAVRCHPTGDIEHYVLLKKYKGGQKFSKSQTPLELATESVKKCSKFVDEVLREYQPPLTLGMGPLAAKALGHETGNVANLRVRVHPRPGLQAVKRKQGTIITYDRYITTKSSSAKWERDRDLEKLRGLATTGVATPQGDKSTIVIHTLDTVELVKQFVDYVLKTKWEPKEVWLFDFETANLLMNADVNRILNVGFTRRYEEDTSYVIPLAHSETPFTPEELRIVYKELKRLFRSKGASFLAWGAHHAVFETQMVKLVFGIWLGEDGGIPIIDTERIAYLLDEDRKEAIKDPNALETLAQDYLGFTWYADTQIKGQRANLDKKPIAEVNEYVGIDSSVTARLLNVLLQRAMDEGSDEDILRLETKLYAPATLYTVGLTLTGQKVNVDLLRKLRAPDSSVVHRIKEIEKEFAGSAEVAQALELLNKKAFGGMRPTFSTGTTEFSLNSQEHRKALFWDVLELDGADVSVDKKFQEKYEKTVPLVKLYSEYQGLAKLDSSYLEPIAEFLQSLNSPDGRLRPRFNLINTATGRLAGQDPNSQNMPRSNTDDKKQIKALFTAEDGWVLVQLDFSQAEVRWLGVIAGDSAIAAKYRRAMEIDEELLRDPTNVKLKQAKKIDGDIHMATALTMYKQPWDLPFTNEDLAKALRQKAKTVCFGLIYGKTAKSLAIELGIELEEAEEAIEKWMAQFPEAADWLRDIEDVAVNDHFVRSPFGRWRRLPEVNSFHTVVANRAKRQARNTPIQSAASDCCIYAACTLRRALMTSTDPELQKVKLINTVHDSLVAEVPGNIETVLKYTQLARSIFTNPNLLMADFNIPITVPMAVDFDIGFNWGNMRDYDFSDEALERSMYDAEVIRNSPPGTLLKHVEKKLLCYDQAVLKRPLPEKK